MSLMGDSMIQNEMEDVRIRNAYLMIPMIKNALVIQGSYHFPFDSLPTVSLVTAPDNSFRIFTWNLILDNGTSRHFGAMQHQGDDRLLLTPLFDASSYIKDPENEILDKNNWYGAVYYNIISRKIDGKDYYFLFGIDAHDMISNKKVMEVMYFDEKRDPVFGAPLIEWYVDSIKQVTLPRFFIEYNDAAAASLNYYEDYGKIIFDHLIPRNPRSKGVKSTFISDGTYEGFEFRDGKWYHINKVFHEAINEFDNPPVPKPVDFDKEKMHLGDKKN